MATAVRIPALQSVRGLCPYSWRMALVPMTLEGCVVRMADTISYIGRDIEDAIRLKMVRRAELPRASVRVLGDTNGAIVYNLVTDVIANSYQQDDIAFSAEISAALRLLKDFNLDRIYLNPQIKKHFATIQELFALLFDRFLNDLVHDRRDSVIFVNFLQDMSDDYLNGHRHEEIVRDFIAGMTDRYFLAQCPADKRPQIRTL